MRVTIVIVISVLLGMGACKEKGTGKEDILSEDKMQAVLWDMIRADHFLNNYMIVKDTSLKKKEASIKQYNQILQIHKISEETFKKSFAYYRSNPKVMWTMMDSLSKMQDEAPTKRIEPVSAADSLPRPLNTPATDTSRLPRKIKPVSAD